MFCFTGDPFSLVPNKSQNSCKEKISWSILDIDTSDDAWDKDSHPQLCRKKLMKTRIDGTHLPVCFFGWVEGILIWNLLGLQEGVKDRQYHSPTWKLTSVLWLRTLSRRMKGCIEVSKLSLKDILWTPFSKSKTLVISLIFESEVFVLARSDQLYTCF